MGEVKSTHSILAEFSSKIEDQEPIFKIKTILIILYR